MIYLLSEGKAAAVAEVKRMPYKEALWFLKLLQEKNEERKEKR